MALSIGGQHTLETRDAMVRNWAGHEKDDGHELNTLATIARLAGPAWGTSTDGEFPPVDLWDIGCGPCRAKRFFPNSTYHGIDAEAAWAEKIDPGIDFRVGSVYETGLPSDSCELVLCNEVLFHVCDWNAAVTELWRITKDRLVFSSYFDTRFTARIPFVGKHSGARQTIVENRETGHQWTSTHNVPPRWMITRCLNKKLRPRPSVSRFLWTKPRQGHSTRTGFAYVVIDK